MAKSLKQQTVFGMIWNGVERLGSSILLFITNLILARLLSPEDFGSIGMLMVFISLSDAIVDGGFGSALIQKKDTTQTDYSTIFYWNVILSIFLYIVLYSSSTTIANFYGMPLLSSVLRVQGMILIINALFLTQQTLFKKQVAFKKIAKNDFSGIVIGTCAGIVSAYMGFGIWSLVIKTLTTAMMQCIAYWISSNWRPQLIFSWGSFAHLFKFGSFIFLAIIINVLYHNLLSLIIGKKFSSATLGYFAQAKKLEEIPRNSISLVVVNVSFPVFSQIQNDRIRVHNAARKSFKSLMYASVPLMVLLLVLAEPLVTLLFTSKWDKSIPYFQVLCVYGILTLPIELNREIMKALGESKKIFYIMIIQRGLGFILVITGLFWGMKGMLIGYVLSQFVGCIISAVMSGKLIGYGLIKQGSDILSVLCISLIAAIITALFPIIISNLGIFCMLCLQFAIYLFIYISLSVLFKIGGREVYFSFIKNSIRK